MSARKSASGVSYAEDDDSSLSSISSDRDSDAEDEQGTDLLVPLPSDAAPSSASHEITSSWEVAVSPAHFLLDSTRRLFHASRLLTALVVRVRLPR